MCTIHFTPQKRYRPILILVLIFFPALLSLAADQPSDNEQQATIPQDFNHVEAQAQKQLQDSVIELNDLRQQIVSEKIPLSQKLNDLESQLGEVRRQYQNTTRMLDSRTLDLSNLRTEIQSRKDEKTYLSTLLDEYIRNFETRLHISELDRYHDVLEAAKLAPDSVNLDETEAYKNQAALVSASLDRLEEALGGARFDGTAVDTSGRVQPGTFTLLGPVALFRSKDGKTVGTAEQRLGSLEPTIIAFEDDDTTQEAAQVVTTGQGLFPLDPTLGNAHKIEATKETLWEHISKGGVVMVPILGLASAALLVALFKWIELVRLKNPADRQLVQLLDAVARHEEAQTQTLAAGIKGPVGEMLRAGVEHLRQPPELVEEVMYEKILTAKLKLQRLLPFVAISASSAPLLGLLGTVTGIINTFKLITVFGSGDVKMLSGGISEALITTEYGLIVAIPSLLLHAFLSRKARGIIDRMEKAAISLSNQLAMTPYHQPESRNGLDRLSVDQIRAVCHDLSSAEGTRSASVPAYRPHSAGSMMDTRVLSVTRHQTVAEAIGTIRSAGMDEEYVCVVDEHGKFVGDVRVLQLLTQPDSESLDSLINTDTPFVRIDADQTEVHNLLYRNGKKTLPVLDQDGQLVGQVSRNGNGQETK